LVFDFRFYRFGRGELVCFGFAFGGFGGLEGEGLERDRVAVFADDFFACRFSVGRNADEFVELSVVAVAATEREVGSPVSGGREVLGERGAAVFGRASFGGRFLGFGGFFDDFAPFGVVDDA
jgi:hypothetical protein